MNCDAVREMILAGLDAAPSTGRGREMREHLEGCEDCARFLSLQTFADQELSAAFGNINPGPTMLAKIRNASLDRPPDPMPAWLPDVLNGAGALFVAAVIGHAGLSTDFGILTVLIALTLIATASYPVVLLRKSWTSN